MARKLTRREITLAGLLAVVAVVVLYYSGGEAPTASGGVAAPGTGAAAAVGTAPAIDCNSASPRAGWR